MTCSQVSVIGLIRVPLYCSGSLVCANTSSDHMVILNKTGNEMRDAGDDTQQRSPVRLILGTLQLYGGCLLLNVIFEVRWKVRTVKCRKMTCITSLFDGGC